MQPVHRYKIPYKYICYAREFRYIKNREKDDFVSGKNVPEKNVAILFSRVRESICTMFLSSR